MKEMGSCTADRAAELLDAQRDLDDLCGFCPRDPLVRAAYSELFSKSKAEGVRLRPQASIFPQELRTFEYVHAEDGCGMERNLVVLLHGFGSRSEPFAEFAKGLKLPKTAALAMNGLDELPPELLDAPPGFGWFSMIDKTTYEFIKPLPGERRRLESLQRTGELLFEALHALMETFGWHSSEIFLFGYGQGGTLALDLLLRPSPSLRELGAVIGIATEVLPERLAQLTHKPVEDQWAIAPPVLLIHGSDDRLTTVAAAEASVRCLQRVLKCGKAQVQLRVFAGRGGEMLRGHDSRECKCLMKFLADHLRGVGRHGSKEAMDRLGAELVEDVLGLD